ncbi:F0F1 ATP synthase subunit delta [Microcoleus sp. FACHB-1515]|uniref:ATP synthase F1 subunit delta n=1 Tax=Cyanophyceae TaxID=3028117 RepID=UPI00168A3323|nr:ATP synthase F1 subunit delta [Microcoleus sp. FACHB-1515]MBD2089633.1 F0F1 ATP synthase subunit delta [Microcoleus sp. FACHB-1515]
MKDNLAQSEIFEPYAQALMSIAQSNNQVDRIGDDVNYLLGLLNESEDFKTLLSSPLVKPDAKKGVLRQIANDQVHPYTLNFLLVLVDRGRILFLEGILKQFQALLRELRQTVLAEVTSAVELNDGQKEAVKDRVRRLVDAQQVDLETRIDPDLMGGVVIKVGSQVIDASLRGQLRRIGLRLTSSV